MFALEHERQVIIRQKREIAEFFGFETRNKYEIRRADNTLLGYAAEQGKGFLGQIMRQFLGHWRSFEIQIFSPERQLLLRAVHPFRWFFRRIEVFDNQGRLHGAIQHRLAFQKKFDVENELGQVIFQMRSPLWRVWTFPFFRQGQEIAVIKKKWSGLLNEGFTDKDTFVLEFNDSGIKATEKSLMLAAALFVDLLYFEKKAS